MESSRKIFRSKNPPNHECTVPGCLDVFSEEWDYKAHVATCNAEHHIKEKNGRVSKALEDFAQLFALSTDL